MKSQMTRKYLLSLDLKKRADITLWLKIMSSVALKKNCLSELWRMLNGGRENAKPCTHLKAIALIDPMGDSQYFLNW